MEWTQSGSLPENLEDHQKKSGSFRVNWKVSIQSKNLTWCEIYVSSDIYYWKSRKSCTRIEDNFEAFQNIWKVTNKKNLQVSALIVKFPCIFYVWVERRVKHAHQFRGETYDLYQYQGCLEIVKNNRIEALDRILERQHKSESPSEREKNEMRELLLKQPSRSMQRLQSPQTKGNYPMSGSSASLQFY